MDPVVWGCSGWKGMTGTMYMEGTGFTGMQTQHGQKSYELSNHLGNVLAVVSDKKVQTDGVLWQAEVVSAQDFFPFGMAMPGRSTDAKHRYTFNGKETDPETGIQDYGMRWYLPNIARFPSVDPLTASYPWYTPYQFAGNKPIQAVDVDGLEEEFKFDSFERNDKRNAERLYPNDPEKQKQSVRNAQVARATGTLIGAGAIAAVYTGGRIIPLLARLTVWVMQPQNQALVMEGTALIAGAFYNGPEDLCPQCKGDEIAKVLKGSGIKILDFMGGKISKYSNALNIDMQAEKGVKSTLQEFTKFAKANKLEGTVDQIIIDNPFGYADYLEDASVMLKQGATLVVRGTDSNKYFNQISKGKAKGLEGFEIVMDKAKVSDEIKSTMKQSDGSAIKGDIYEIVLKKK